MFNYTRISQRADPIDSEVKGVGLRPLACWDCGFQSRRRHGCLSLVSVVCVVRYTSVRRADRVSRKGLTECGVSECVCEASIMRRPWTRISQLGAWECHLLLTVTAVSVERCQP